MLFGAHITCVWNLPKFQGIQSACTWHMPRLQLEVNPGGDCCSSHLSGTSRTVHPSLEQIACGYPTGAATLLSPKGASGGAAQAWRSRQKYRTPLFGVAS